MNARLKINMIIDGKNYPRDSVVDDQLIPERFRTEEHVAYDLEHRDTVLLLRDLSFQSEPRPGADGVRTSFPVFVGKGETLDLTQVPAGKRQEPEEGLDFKTNWSFEDQAEQRRSSEEEYLAQFQAEEPAVQAAWR